MTFVAGAVDLGVTTLSVAATASGSTPAANDSDTFTITVAALDANSNPVIGYDVAKISGSISDAASEGVAITDAALSNFTAVGDGTYTATVQAKQAIEHFVTISLDGAAITNASNPVSMTFVAGAVDLGVTTLSVAATASGSTPAANDSDTFTITVAALDANSNPVIGYDVAKISGSISDAASEGVAITDAALSNFTAVGDGTYTATVQAKQAIEHFVTISLDGAAITNASNPVSMTFVAGAVDLGVTTLSVAATASGSTPAANDSDTFTITVAALDANSNPVIGYDVAKISGSISDAASEGVAITDAALSNFTAVGDGTYTATVQAKQAIEHFVTISLDGAAITNASNPVSMTFVAGAVDLGVTTLSVAATASGSTPAANDSDTFTITVAALDANSNPVIGYDVAKISGSISDAASEGVAITDAALSNFTAVGDGTYTATVQAKQAIEHFVTISLDGAAITNASNPVSMTFVAGAVDLGVTTLSVAATASGSTPAANDSDTFTITVAALDANSNPVIGYDVAKISGSISDAASEGVAITDAALSNFTAVGDGTYTATVQAKQAIEHFVTISLDGAAITNASNPVSMTFVAGAVDLGVTTLSVAATASGSTPAANDSDTFTITVAALDANSNPVIGYDVAKISGSISDAASEGVAITDAALSNFTAVGDGTYTATVQAKQAIEHFVTISLDGAAITNASNPVSMTFVAGAVDLGVTTLSVAATASGSTPAANDSDTFTITVAALDANSNPVIGYDVAKISGSISDAASEGVAITDAALSNFTAVGDGTYTATVQAKQAIEHFVTISLDGAAITNASNPVSMTFVAGAVDLGVTTLSVAATASGSTPAANDSDTFTITVAALDANSNPVIGYDVAKISGSISDAASEGVAITDAALSNFTAVGDGTYTATVQAKQAIEHFVTISLDGAAITNASNPVSMTFVAGAVDLGVTTLSVAATASGSTPAANDSDTFTITVAALDANSNPVIGYDVAKISGSISDAASEGVAITDAALSNFTAVGDGTYTATVQAKQAIEHFVTISLDGAAITNASNPVSMTFVAGAVDLGVTTLSVAATASGSTPAANDSDTFTITVAALDANSNPVIGYDVAKISGSISDAASEGVAITDAALSNFTAVGDGTYTATVQAKQAIEHFVTISLDGAAITNASNPVSMTFVAGAVDLGVTTLSVAATASGSTPAANDSDTFTITVAALDANSNPVIGYDVAKISGSISDAASEGVAITDAALSNFTAVGDGTYTATVQAKQAIEHFVTISLDGAAITNASNPVSMTFVAGAVDLGVTTLSVAATASGSTPAANDSDTFTITVAALDANSNPVIGYDVAKISGSISDAASEGVAITDAALSNFTAVGDGTYTATVQAKQAIEHFVTISLDGAAITNASNPVSMTFVAGAVDLGVTTLSVAATASGSTPAANDSDTFTITVAALDANSNPVIGYDVAKISGSISDAASEGVAITDAALSNFTAVGDGTYTATVQAKQAIEHFVTISLDGAAITNASNPVSMTFVAGAVDLGVTTLSVAATASGSTPAANDSDTFTITVAALDANSNPVIGYDVAKISGSISDAASEGVAITDAALSNFTAVGDGTYTATVQAKQAIEHFVTISLDGAAITNASNPVSMTFVAGAVDLGVTTLSVAATASGSTPAANDSDTFTITVAALDANSNPVIGYDVAKISGSISDAASEGVAITDAALSNFTAVGDGTYTATVQAKQAIEHFVTISLDGAAITNASNPVSMTFVAGAVDLGVTTLSVAATASGSTPAANDSDTFTITVAALDANSNPVIGYDVAKISGSISDAASEGVAITDAALSNFTAVGDGTYTATVQAKQAIEHFVTISLDGAAITNASNPVSMTFVAGAVDLGVTTLSVAATASGSTPAANDSDTFTITVAALDANSNPVIGYDVAKISGSISDAASEGVAITDAALSNFTAVGDGTYTATVQAKQAIEHFVTISLDGAAITNASNPVSMTFVAGAVDLGVTTLSVAATASGSTPAANDSDTFTITVAALDANSNPVIGYDVAKISGSISDAASEGVAITDAALSNFTAVGDGTYTATVQAKQAIEHFVTISLDGAAITNASNPVSMTFVAGAVDLGVTTLSVAATASGSTPAANDSDTFTITVAALDANSNPVIGYDVAKISGSISDAASEGVAITDAALSNFTAVGDGTYTATVQAKQAIEHFVTISLDGAAITNASNPVSMTFVAGAVDLGVTTLSVAATASGSTPAANDSDTFTITVAALDANSNPVIGYDVAKISGSISDAASEGVAITDAALSNFTAVGDGTYTATVQAKQAIEHFVTISLDGAAITNASNPVSMTFVAGAVDLGVTTLSVAATASGSTPAANDSDTFTITVAALDANSNPVIGYDVAKISGSISDAASEGVAITDAALSNFTAVGDGTYTATVQAKQAIEHFVTISLDGAAITNASNPVSMTFVVGDASAANSTISVAESSLVADGTTTVVTVQAKDATRPSP